MRSLEERIITKNDDNIDELRRRYPGGLHFAVGDVHDEVSTLMKLMEKIKFNPDKDHVYFVGDYNGGGNTFELLRYMADYFQADFNAPGFHMIRGNHERELYPVYMLENLPDIIVIRGKKLVFYIVHAGMVSSAFELISDDIAKEPDKTVYAYRLEDNTCEFNAPLRQIVWSMRGLYSQNSHWRVWPREEELISRNACIIHGHSPYCFFKEADRFTYGSDNLFWQKQHMWFCSELRSFNIDSNVKGRYQNGESYRGLSCICMEVYDELAAKNDGKLTADLVYEAENGIFGVELDYSMPVKEGGSPDRILGASVEMKTIGVEKRQPVFRDETDAKMV